MADKKLNTTSCGKKDDKRKILSPSEFLEKSLGIKLFEYQKIIVNKYFCNKNH